MKKLFLYGFLVLALLVSVSPVSAAPAEDNHRNFILIFQVSEYNSKITDSVEYFFNKILKPEDQVSIFSPVQPYSFPAQSRQAHPIKTIIEKTKDVLKRDINVGTSNYTQTLQSMTQMVQEISNNWGSNEGGLGGQPNPNDLKTQLVQYRQMLSDLRNMRKLNETLFIKLAELLKRQTGKSYIIIFYQKEIRIIPDRETMEALRANSLVRFDATELFDEDRGDEFMDAAKVSQVLKEASVIVDFFYIQTQTIKKTGLESKEFSGDVYNVLSKIADATGGVVIATSKPEAALKKAFAGK